MFRWHIDNKENKTQSKLTVIIFLSNTISPMQILARKGISYKEQGTAIAFLSCSYHKSIYFAGKITKLCFFLKDINIIIAPRPRVRYTRNKRIRKQNGSALHISQWNLYKSFTHQESSTLKQVDGLNYVAPINYHESGDEVEVTIGEDSESKISQLNEEEKQSEGDKKRRRDVYRI